MMCFSIADIRILLVARLASLLMLEAAITLHLEPSTVVAMHQGGQRRQTESIEVGKMCCSHKQRMLLKFGTVKTQYSTLTEKFVSENHRAIDKTQLFLSAHPSHFGGAELVLHVTSDTRNQGCACQNSFDNVDLDLAETEASRFGTFFCRHPLSYYSLLSSNAGHTLTIYASQVSKSWNNEDITWKKRTKYAEWEVPYMGIYGEDAHYPAVCRQLNLSNCLVGQRVTMNLTKLVKDWIIHPEQNHGVLLWAQHEVYCPGAVRFASIGHPKIKWRPKLLLHFKEADETDCPHLNDFRCRGENICLSRHLRCNFRSDCREAEDEAACSKSCDFEKDDSLEKVYTPPGDPCVQWPRPPASDGKPGFILTSGIEIKMQSRRSYGPKTMPGPPLDHPTRDLILNGPLVDDSEKTDKGKYAIFLNAAHTETTEADLESPWYGSTGPRCALHFSLYMVGTNVGKLKVLLHTDSGVLRSMWSVVGDKGNRWRPHKVTLGQIREPFRVIFQAVRGLSDSGYIALDSLSLDYCNPDLPAEKTCALNEFMCETKLCIPRDQVCDFQKDCLGGEDESQPYCDGIPESGRCDFESGLCGWTNLTSHGPMPRFNWTRHHGQTPTKDTGPSVDHTLGTDDGHYIYTKVIRRGSRPHASEFRQYVIYSPVLPPPPVQTWTKGSPFFQSCHVRFFYHMWGMHIISMRISIEEMEEVFPPHCDRGTPQQGQGEHLANIMTRGDGVDAWLRESRPLPKVTRHFRLKFMALIGPVTENSDVALDDFSLSPECFGLGIMNTTSTASEYIEATCNKSVEEEEKECFTIGPILPVKTKDTEEEEQCWWSPSELLKRFNETKASSSAPAFETITEVINSSARFIFKTCGNAGSTGPTQYQCDAAYRSTHLTNRKVRVLTESRRRGVQVWTVPETRLYSITALGASGGTGLQNSDASRGAYANAKFNLTKGDEIFILVGQMGQSACSYIDNENPKTKEICTKGIFLSEGQTKQIGGGGGGGGGTYLFKKDANSHHLTPLIIAGGGGGKSYLLGNHPVRADGGLSPPGPGLSGFTGESGPGSGGGWEGGTNKSKEGHTLLQGAVGGQPCREALETYQWQVYGGFGGGGGGCTAGGGGGGYSGGNVSITDDPGHNGQGGSSYISPMAIKPVFEPGTNEGHGEVEIAIVFPCDCVFMCIYHNYEEKKFKCYCPANHVLAEDGLSCIDPKEIAPDTPLVTIIGIIAGPLAIIIIIISCVLCINAFRNKRPPAAGLGLLTRADYQLGQLRSQVGGPSIMSEYNPNYDFGGTKCTLQDLQEVPRSHLTLVRGLGQGAFGEVYQGYLSNEPREPRELAVAVKTLPALSTDQAEMDFLMEALIMSKFHHANIVRFIGVCFEKHPRFIILELLEGGDLKTFLRDSRPKPDQPSRVTTIDLVKLSLDVAKGCQYLEENHFIHRDIAARNCLLTSKSADRVAKIADFGMARDIYRADYYRKGGKAMLPVKWMPPEAFLDGMFTSKTDVWSFGILLWEVYSLGYMPYPGRGNQEVMQLVTAGGRLEPPDNCPMPVYHIMNMCWHGIPERRPTFTTIINRLERCLQDPEVIHSPLPVFRRPPSIERDTTLMRPRDSDRMVLTVDPPLKYLEPDSPNSMDQLIGPQSPDIGHLLHKKPNLRASAESIDELLHREEKGAASSGDGRARKEDGALPKKNFSYQRVFDYDMAADSLENQADDALEAQAVAEGGTSAAIVGPPQSSSAMGGAGAGGGAGAAQLEQGSYLPAKGTPADGDGESAGDSGKSSLENMSQTDLSSQVSSKYSSGNTSPTQWQQPRVVPKPPQETSGRLAPSGPASSTASASSKNSPAARASTATAAMGKTLCESPLRNQVSHSNSSKELAASANPWELRQVDSTDQPSHPQGDLPAASSTIQPPPQSEGPCYLNIDVATRVRKDGTHIPPASLQNDLPGGPLHGNTAGADPGGGRSPATSAYRNQMPTMADMRQDEEAAYDPGDSGVVIDLKGCNSSLGQHNNNGQTWL